jgi:hypothetical protein
MKIKGKKMEKKIKKKKWSECEEKISNEEMETWNMISELVRN